MSQEIVAEKDKSGELLADLIKTSPVNFISGQVFMNFQGQDFESHKSEVEQRKYLAWCSENSVIPYSQTKLWYSRTSGSYHSDRVNFLDLPEALTEPIEDIINQQLIEGGRVHQIELITSGLGIDRFKDKQLDLFLAGGYLPHLADLWLASYRLSGYNEGTYKDSGVWMDYSRKLDIYVAKLTMGNELDQTAADQVISWFDELSSKYSPILGLA